MRYLDSASKPVPPTPPTSGVQYYRLQPPTMVVVGSAILASPMVTIQAEVLLLAVHFAKVILCCHGNIGILHQVNKMAVT